MYNLQCQAILMMPIESLMYPTKGSYECKCYEGFVGDGFRECINDNECLHRNVKG